MKDIKKIVLTGGPCAGKTTALVRIIEHFSSLGFKVFTIPEVPTLFTQAGMDYLTDNKNFFYEGEKATLEIQLALEDRFLRMAEQCTEPTILVCDRGTMDISAYMSPELWEDITTVVGTSTAELRARYDAVLHLVSAADGA
ncbi:MAG: ATP-binding protein, partial [Prevotella sp.]|nr:ATP-binding protein [Prevotella sp.]